MADNIKMRSSISDEDLAKLIQEDKLRNPSDFSCGPIVYVDSLPKRNLSCVGNASRTVASIRKWL